METSKLLNIIIQSGSFIAAFAAITAGIMMFSVTKKFGTGILASGFKTISIGVIFIAIGIIIDAVNSYLQIQSNIAFAAILIAKELLFVIGTYIIVIGSKKTGDKLESLTK
ncbi:hypothetical protein C4559_05105 [Candidatus Microgenomates bacterium]|nr:MAG: hypothetical protein C4559_05105 [Candidatus Microgenomates bacterium]